MAVHPKLKICIALIHNNDQVRLKYIRPLLEKLKKELSPRYEAEIFEISEEIDETSHKTWVMIWTKLLYWKINREWIRYKLLKPRSILLDVAILSRRLILAFFNRKWENRRTMIQAFVIDKHLKSWNTFLDKKADYSIFFEDDAIFKTDTVLRLKTFLQELNKYKDRPIYLDFAGGNTPEVNKVHKLELKRSKYKIYYKKPVTNTACVYLMNRLSAQIFYIELLRFPWLRIIGIDWILNKMFILTASKYNYLCFHADPYIFDNGSITGAYKSTI